jgi:hypothetical protein
MVENLPPKVRSEEMTTVQGKKYSNIRYAPGTGSTELLAELDDLT